VGERAHDLHDLLEADAQRAGGRRGVDLALEPEALEHRARTGQGRGVVQQAEARRLAPEQQVLGDRQPGHERQLLVHHRDAGPLRVRRASQALQLAVDPHLAAVGAVGVHAGEHLEQRRLARAVLAAEAEDLAGAGGEIRPGERAHAAEALLDAGHLEGRRHLA
jgi:hypothetical protein